MGEMNRFDTDGETVFFRNAPSTMTGRDIIVVVNGKWYRIDVSEDDKVLCLDDTTDDEEAPRFCGYSCARSREHHYYVRLRKEWRIPAMPLSNFRGSLPSR